MHSVTWVAGQRLVTRVRDQREVREMPDFIDQDGQYLQPGSDIGSIMSGWAPKLRKIFIHNVTTPDLLRRHAPHALLK
jgi:hypothetical protein